MTTAALIVLLIGVVIIVLNRPVADPTRDSPIADHIPDEPPRNESEDADVAPTTADVPGSGRRSRRPRRAEKHASVREVHVALGGSPQAFDSAKDHSAEP